jgi:RimJ/RimL family protein N-acetyltransferase
VDRNDLGQPVGIQVDGWRGAAVPDRSPMVGLHCRLETLDADRHAEALHQVYAQDVDASHWTYLPYGPFESASAYRSWVEKNQAADDPYFFAIVDGATDRPVGVASFLRVSPESGSIEVGHLRFSSALQRTPLSTEAMYLMMKRAFDDWGYRRYEWKCHHANAPSVAAARRLGFRFEGLFRNHVVVKGRNRDTAWLSIVDDEWPGIRDAMEAWLDPDNFDANGGQRQRLAALMPVSAGTPIVVEVDPA